MIGVLEHKCNVSCKCRKQSSTLNFLFNQKCGGFCTVGIIVTSTGRPGQGKKVGFFFLE